ncbi:MAG: VanW family protein [Angelakisella sp.]
MGRTTARKGYLPGLTIGAGRLGAETGGGLCQLANLIHWMVLNSPLTVTELHHHTDALFPDSGRRVPFGTGTSIFYKNVDYRFRNDTDTPVQLLIWQEEHDLCGELRAQHAFPYRWRIIEEDHHFQREADGHYYRCSRIYRVKTDCEGNELDRELLLINHSQVMYDPALIPPEQLREELPC